MVQSLRDTGSYVMVGITCICQAGYGAVGRGYTDRIAGYGYQAFASRGFDWSIINTRSVSRKGLNRFVKLVDGPVCRSALGHILADERLTSYLGSDIGNIWSNWATGMKRGSNPRYQDWALIYVTEHLAPTWPHAHQILYSRPFRLQGVMPLVLVTARGVHSSLASKRVEVSADGEPR